MQSQPCTLIPESQSPKFEPEPCPPGQALAMCRGERLASARRLNIEQLKRGQGLLTENQGHNLALTVLHVPCSEPYTLNHKPGENDS